MSTLPFLAGIVLAALSSSLWQVLLSRCLAGLGDGIMYPNIMGEQESIEFLILITQSDWQFTSPRSRARSCAGA